MEEPVYQMGKNSSVNVRLDLLGNSAVRENVFTFICLNLQPRVHDLNWHIIEKGEARYNVRSQYLDRAFFLEPVLGRGGEADSFLRNFMSYPTTFSASTVCRKGET